MLLIPWNWIGVTFICWFWYTSVNLGIKVANFSFVLFFWLFFILTLLVFSIGQGDRSLIPDRVIPKTQKMVLDVSLLNTEHYKVRIKGKQSNLQRGVAPSPAPPCSSYCKESHRVVLDNGRPTYIRDIFTGLLERKMQYGRPKREKVSFGFTIFLKLMSIGLVGRVFANGPGDLSSIPGRVIP